MANKEEYVCPTCHHTSNKYWHRVSPGMVDALIKFRQAVAFYQRNSIHIYRDMEGMSFELSTAQQMNWTKLRFHGLVAKVKEDGERKHGCWLLTTKGRLFLDGERSISRKVQTLNNHVIDRDPETVNVRQVASYSPEFDDYHFWHQSKEPEALETAQAELPL